MGAPRDRKHIFLTGFVATTAYKGKGAPREKPPLPKGGRPAHGGQLRAELQKAEAENHSARNEEHTAHGVFIEFESIPDWELPVATLEKRNGKNIPVVSVKTTQVNGKLTQFATVFVPDGELRFFLDKLRQYEKTIPPKKRERRHHNLFDRINAIRLATIRAFWTDTDENYPESDETIWWEIWLRRSEGKEFSRFQAYAKARNLFVSKNAMAFRDRVVVNVKASPQQLADMVHEIEELAELRRAAIIATALLDAGILEQRDWASDLASRTILPAADAPSVCILDSGVMQGHALLEHALLLSDCHACEPNWGNDDHAAGDGHGTLMAGLALYGDLSPALASNATIQLTHNLESVKILPRYGANVESSYGRITAVAAELVETTATRKRCFSMAVTAPLTSPPGQPTSWSAAVDALATGANLAASNTTGIAFLDDGSKNKPRLFVISAGNVDNRLLSENHLENSDTRPVEDPAQAWNALTVGGYTEKAAIVSRGWESSLPLAPPGELSPWSTTSVLFERGWPIKPEVLFEGGNAVLNTAGAISDDCPDLLLLSTSKRQGTLFGTANATSAACAQAARLAAVLMAEYPNCRAETTRGLIVHSARWTPQMERNLTSNRKDARLILTRRYGYGVANEDRALRSGRNALTLVTEQSIGPYHKRSADAEPEIHIYSLPWPIDALRSLGASEVKLRVTLSYFIDPNPARRGKERRYQYASHGLRFDVKRPTESKSEFLTRINKAIENVETSKAPPPDENGDWFLGLLQRSTGSIHSDVLTTTAAELADRGILAVYPVKGWWSEVKREEQGAEKVPYSLIVSIETDDESVDIWTPVATQIEIATVTI